jgi:hypothetical protein
LLAGMCTVLTLNLARSLLILLEVPCIKGTVATMAGFYHCECVILGLRAHWISQRLSVTLDHWTSVEGTIHFCDGWWWELEHRYKSVCVGFL